MKSARRRRRCAAASTISPERSPGQADRRARPYEDTATKFLEHFAYIADALRSKGLWNEGDGFFYDVLALDDGRRMPLCVRSMAGLLPLCATTTLGTATLARLPEFATRRRG